MRNFEVILGQILNHSLNVEFCNAVHCHILNYLFDIIKFSTHLFSHHDNGKIPNPHLHLVAFLIKVVLNIIDIYTVAEKDSSLCINLFVYRKYNMG
jgi:hypothetical protein